MANLKLAAALIVPIPRVSLGRRTSINISPSPSHVAERTDVRNLVFCLDGVCDQEKGFIRISDGQRFSY